MRKPEEIATAFSPREALEGKTSFFLVGIGGAGMSALARMMKKRGFTVRGTDSTRSPETDRLEAEGFEVILGHTGEKIRPEDVLVVSDAIDLSISPEVARARELGIPMVRRSQALGWLLKPYKTIAVTGTHGKTTTTGMIGAGLIAAGLDPLVVVGASIPQWGGPVREGEGEWAVVEACEAYDSFHDLDPYLVVLTNLELDHVDFHGSWENLKASVQRFMSRVPPDGAVVYCEEDAGAVEVVDQLDHSCQLQSYARWSWDEFGPDDIEDYMWELRHYSRLPGEHNALNAMGAYVAAYMLDEDVDMFAVLRGIYGFGGAERRLQPLLYVPITVIDDYAHHPTEIEASLNAILLRYLGREGTVPTNPGLLDAIRQSGVSPGRLIVVYQPHLYSRTEPLIPEFAEALSLADLVVLTDIYPAREDPIPGVSSARIAELVTKPCIYIPSRHLLPRKLAQIAKPGDVVVGMGAGNIADFAPAFIKEIQREGKPRVAVAYGGDSAEREVSLHSGRAVHEALQRKGYRSELVDFSELLLSKGDLKRFVGDERPDVVFLAVHGTHAEDGAIQGLLELLHIPYTGSGIQASALAMNKELAKQILCERGMRVPKGILLTEKGQSCLKPPLVVKPNAQGSTVGLSFVEREEDLEPAIERAFAYDDAVLVEEWVKGMEISVPVLGDRALPVVEIAPRSGRYDFASKYLPGATEEIVPARLPEKTLQRAQEIAVQAHRALGCEGATRTDMIVPEPYEIADPVVLEVNTLPGMTSTSLLPNSAKAAGIAFDELVEWMVEDALERYAEKA